MTQLWTSSPTASSWTTRLSNNVREHSRSAKIEQAVGRQRSATFVDRAPGRITLRSLGASHQLPDMPSAIADNICITIISASVCRLPERHRLPDLPMHRNQLRSRRGHRPGPPRTTARNVAAPDARAPQTAPAGPQVAAPDQCRRPAGTSPAYDGRAAAPPLCFAR